MINLDDLEKFLEGVDFPASKQEIVRNARQKGARQDVLVQLEKLPDDDFESVTDVADALEDMEVEE